MRKYIRQNQQAKEKAANRERLSLEAQLPMSELIAGVRDDIEAFAAELGLTLIQRVMAEEIQQKLGPWGQQPVSRHGHQAGYVIFGGRKVTLERPRLRSQDKEVGLASYRAFQRNGKLQKAVARQVMRQCSTRDYEGAIEGCLKGYGIKRSSVSRHWKAATAEELERLMQRPVPKDLLVLMIDSKFFAGDCLVAAIGVDLQGKKHVLGLWHGATENATVVKGLLEDLVSRGLESERKMLIVLDGAKALRKAVTMVLGGARVSAALPHSQVAQRAGPPARGKESPGRLALASRLGSKRRPSCRERIAQNRPLAGRLLAHGGGELAGRLRRNPDGSTLGHSSCALPDFVQHQPH